MKADTIIIGGGIAGLSCARRLYDQGRDFRLFTDRLGGRMYASEIAGRNFGATYITSDYRHVSRFVREGNRIEMRDVYFWDEDRFITLFHVRNLRRVQAIQRLYCQLILFRRSLNRLRSRSPWFCQSELLQADPLLQRAVEEPATEFIQRFGLREIDRVFLNPIIRSTVFAGTAEVNTFYYLACLMPILLPTYIADLSSTLESMTAGFSHRISLAKVLSLREAHDGFFTVTTEHEELRARQVVVATPSHNTRVFCPELAHADYGEVREIPVSTLHVSGRRRADYQPGKPVFLPAEHPARVLVPIGGADGDLSFAANPAPDLSDVYENYHVDESVTWKVGIILSGSKWRPLVPRRNLYTIGDHNICGLEDSFLTGLFAANRILAA